MSFSISDEFVRHTDNDRLDSSRTLLGRDSAVESSDSYQSLSSE